MFLNLGFRVYLSSALVYHAITSVIVRLEISAHVFVPVGSYIPNPNLYFERSVQGRQIHPLLQILSHQ